MASDRASMLHHAPKQLPNQCISCTIFLPFRFNFLVWSSAYAHRRRVRSTPRIINFEFDSLQCVCVFFLSFCAREQFQLWCRQNAKISKIIISIQHILIKNTHKHTVEPINSTYWLAEHMNQRKKLQTNWKL